MKGKDIALLIISIIAFIELIIIIFLLPMKAIEETKNTEPQWTNLQTK